jgi:hypothetical protein
MCSSSPDMTAANTAAAASAKTGEDALSWYKQMYADSAPDRAAASADAHAVSAAELQQMQEQGRIASDYDQYNRTTFRPLEQGIVSEANNFDTEAKRSELAGKALADVNQNFGSARAQEGRQMARLGVNPADGAYAAEATQRGNAEALAGAGAETKARSDAMLLGHAMKMDAASLGRNLPSNQVAAAQSSINAGNASAYNAGLPLSQQQQQAAMMGAGYGYGIQGNQVAGNLYGNIANVQTGVNNSNNATAGGLGAAAGTVAAAVII